MLPYTTFDSSRASPTSSLQEEALEEDEGDLVSSAPLKPSSGNKTTGTWDWRKDLYALIQNKAGLIKLNAERPSTASIGNWGILEVTQRLSEAHGLGSQVSARLFMGKKKTSKSKVDVGLSRKDTEDAIKSQWDALRLVCTVS